MRPDTLVHHDTEMPARDRAEFESSADEEEDTANEGADFYMNELDEIELTDDGEVTSDDDSDAAGPENVDKEGNLEVPQGQRMLNRPPAPLNFAAVRRLKIALKWPFGD